MTDRGIKQLATQFRKAIENARDAEEFKDDIRFYKFPYACCGDTGCLLAEYLRSYGVETIWVSNRIGEGSHAWLVIKDERVTTPMQRYNHYPENIWDVLKSYGVSNHEKPICVTRYEIEDLEGGLIVDITSDQFDNWNIPIYVGLMDDFHRNFSFIQAHDYGGLDDLNGRLKRLYRIIEKYIR